MSEELKGGYPPRLATLAGKYCRLEPLKRTHAPALYAAVCADDRLEERFKYLPDPAPQSLDDLKAAITNQTKRPDHMHFAVIDAVTGKCGGRQAFMRIRPEHRSVEVGFVLWGKGVAGTRMATESIFLMAKHVFEDLGYFRFEWKCNALNEPSWRAAIRFGFTYEGIFRNDMIVKGEHRDTAWFSMTHEEWPALKEKYEAWLSPDNFVNDGVAITKLDTPRKAVD